MVWLVHSILCANQYHWTDFSLMLFCVHLLTKNLSFILNFMIFGRTLKAPFICDDVLIVSLWRMD